MEMTDLLAAAAEIRDAQQAGENTADRVGTLLVNIIQTLCQVLPATGIDVKATAAGTGITVTYRADDGTPVSRDVLLPAATTTIPGLLSATDKAKIDRAADAELLDALQEAHGTLAALALRTTDLTLRTGVNMADKERITTGYVSNTGLLINSDAWKRAAIDVSQLAEGTQLTFGGFHLGRSGYYAFYRGGTATANKVSNGNFHDPQGTSAPVTVAVPEGGADTLYFCIFKDGSSTVPEGWTTAYDELTCALGAELPAYVPYGMVVTAIQGHPLAGTSASGASASGDILFDLPLSPDGAGIEQGYAYVNSATGVVTVKLAAQ